jgi:xylose isomerase
MVADYKRKIGASFTLLIEPKPKEPCAHQYDYDAATVMGFLRYYGLEKDFKLNIEPNHTTLAGHAYAHDVALASAYGMLGSIDANTGNPALGWDTDEFLTTDLRSAVQIMQVVVRQGGLGGGGLNFDARVRRESTDPADIFHGHITSMDCFAKALRIVERMDQDGVWARMRADRYASFADTEVGRSIATGQASLESLAEHALELPAGDVKQIPSGQEELWNQVFARYLY